MEPLEFNPTVELMQQVRELRRDVSEIRTAQAKQPTREDLQNYVLKEVFDLKVAELEKVDQGQEERLNEHEDHIQTSAQRLITNTGILVAVASGLFGIIHSLWGH